MTESASSEFAALPYVEQLRAVSQIMIDGSPQARALGFKFVDLEEGMYLLKADWNARLVGDPDRGVIAGGVLTTMLDHACGFACNTALPRLMPVVTLDLRIDYLRPAKPGATVFARAVCEKLTRRIAFARGAVWDEDEGDPVAFAASAFAIRDQSEESSRESILFLGSLLAGGRESEAGAAGKGAKGAAE